MPDWQIDFYETESGRVPFDKAINTLPQRGRDALTGGIVQLKAEGMGLGEPLVKGLSGFSPLRELRIRAGKDQWRLFFFAAGGRRLVAVEFCSRASVSNSTLETAWKRMRDWKARNP